MNKLEDLVHFQLEWLEAVKYDEYLKAIEICRQNPTDQNKKTWDIKENEYLQVINQIENNQSF